MLCTMEIFIRGEKLKYTAEAVSQHRRQAKISWLPAANSKAELTALPPTSKSQF